jgi:alpha-galactosidase
MALGEVNASAGSVLFTSDDVSVYGETENRIFNGIMRMRNADIISAALDDDELVVSYMLGEKLITRTYKL